MWCGFVCLLCTGLKKKKKNQMAMFDNQSIIASVLVWLKKDVLPSHYVLCLFSWPEYIGTAEAVFTEQ